MSDISKIKNQAPQILKKVSDKSCVKPENMEIKDRVVLSDSSSQTDDDIRKSISGVAKAGLSDMSSLTYYAQIAKTGRDSLKAIKKQVAKDSSEGVVTGTALRINEDAPASAAYEGALTVLSAGIQGPVAIALAEAGSKAVSHGFQYYALTAKASRPFLEAINKQTPKGSWESILTGEVLDIDINAGGPAVAAYDSAFKAISSGTGEPVNVKLAKAGLKASNHGFEYYSHMIQASRPFLEAINKQAPKGSNEAILTEKILGIDIDAGGPTVIAYNSAFNVILSGTKEPVVVTLAKAGMEASNYDFKYFTHKIMASRPFLEAINEQAPKGSNEAILSEAILGIDINNGGPTAASYKGTFKVISSAGKESLCVASARAGMDAMSSGFKYYAHMNKAGRPFLDVIKKHAIADSNEEILADVALGISKNDDGSTTAVYEAVLGVIMSGEKDPIGTAIAKAGLKALNHNLKQSSQKIDATRPFLEAIKKNSNNFVETEIARKSLSAKPDYETYKKALKSIIRSHDKVKPTADMIEQYRKNMYGKPGDASKEGKRIIIKEDVVNIGGVELSRKGSRKSEVG